MSRIAPAALAALLAVTAPMLAHELKAGNIEIGHPWSRPTPPSAPVASGYLKLTNTGAEADRLTGISSRFAQRAEIHRSTVADGVASMRPVDGLTVEPGTTIDFEVEKLHVMFITPDRQLKDGDRFPATLVFENAGPVDVEFVVQRRGAEPAAADHSGHGG